MSSSPGPAATDGPSTLNPEAGAKDGQLVTADGRSLVGGIDGVVTRPTLVHSDERGEVAELLSVDWPQALGAAVPHVYLATIMPGVIKGWVCHRDQSDRSVLLFGRLRWVLYDGRAGSPTAGLVQKLSFTDHNRHLVVVPPGVWHAVENIGIVEAAFVNMPTRAYQHDDPDKFRLPLDTPEIPFRFAARR